MKKQNATMRQINAVRDELSKKRQKAMEDWRSKNPRPSWEEEDAWEKKHRSPQRIHDTAMRKVEGALLAKHDALLFDARMGKITADELYHRFKAL